MPLSEKIFLGLLLTGSALLIINFGILWGFIGFWLGLVSWAWGTQ